MNQIIKTWGLGALVLALLALVATPALAQEKRLDDWNKNFSPNEDAPGWQNQKFSPTFGSGDTFFFQFYHDATNHYLHLKSGKNNSFSVGSKFKFKLSDFPVLEWDWQANVLPKGGDVHKKATDDQAGQMCVTVNPGLTGSTSVCYLWDNQGKKGEKLTSTKHDNIKYVMLRVATEDKTGTWFHEKVNILADYTAAYGKPTKDAIIGISIDSDDTKSSADINYKNIVLKKQ